MADKNETDHCTWTFTEHPDYENWEYWESDCGGKFTLEDGTPDDNGMRYCCYCGKPMKQKIIDTVDNGDV